MPSPGDLCTRDEVVALFTPSTPNYALIDRLIVAASAALCRAAGREFATEDVDEHVTGTGGTNESVTYTPAIDIVRRFGVPYAPWSTVAVVPVGDLAAPPTRIDIVNPSSGVVVESDVSLTGVEAWPLARRSWQPITELAFHRSLSPEHRIDVTGQWGFPEIPADIRQAAIAQVREWYVRDPSRFGEAFLGAEGGVDIPSRELSLIARDAARAYRVPVVA